MTITRALCRLLAGLAVWLLTAGLAAPGASAAGESLHDAVAAMRAQYRVPGLVVLVVSKNAVVQVEAQGLSVDTPLPIGSTSKQFSGLIVQQLIGQGRLSGDQRLDSLLSYTAGGPCAAVTVNQLLGHQSGLGERVGAEWQLWPPATSIQDEARRVLGTAPTHPAGATFEYSNANYTVLGSVIETVTGGSYSSALRQWVTDPLGLRNTTADPSHTATGHYPWLGGLVTPLAQPQWPLTVPSALISSTAADLGRLLQAQLGATSGIPATVLDAARKPVATEDDANEYASGWSRHRFWQLHDGNADYKDPTLPILFDHQGNTLRTFSYLGFSPERDLGVVILGDTSFGVDQAGQWWLTDRIMHAVAETKPVDYTADPLTSAAPAIMVLLPLCQAAALIWVARSRRWPAAVLGLLVSAATAAMSFWVVPSQTTLPVFGSEFLAAVPDLALAVWTSLALAAGTLIVLVHHGLTRRVS